MLFSFGITTKFNEFLIDNIFALFGWIIDVHVELFANEINVNTLLHFCYSGTHSCYSYSNLHMHVFSFIIYFDFTVMLMSVPTLTGFSGHPGFIHQ